MKYPGLKSETETPESGANRSTPKGACSLRGVHGETRVKVKRRPAGRRRPIDFSLRHNV